MVKGTICFLGIGSLALLSFAAAAEEAPVEELGVRGLIVQALEENLRMEIQRVEIDINQQREVLAGEELLPILTLEATYRDENRAQNQRETLSTGGIRLFEEKRYDGRVGVGKTFATGTQVELSTGMARVTNSLTKEEDAPYDPEYEAVANLSLVQPLLQGFGPAANLAARRAQEFTTAAVRLDARAQFEQTIGQVLLAAYENEFAVENIRVKEEAVALAEQVLAENRRRVEEGMMTPLDVSQAEVRVAEAREELIAARTFYRERQNRLRQLTQSEVDPLAGPLVIAPIGDLLPEGNLEPVALGRRVLAQNPSYRAALERIEAAGIRLQFAKNRSLPSLDLQGSLSYNGLNDQFDDSYHDFDNRTGPTWSLGVVARIPIDRGVAKARVREARQAERQALLQSKQAEVELLTTLDDRVAAVRNAAERRVLVAESVEAAEASLRTAERRLASGLTTTLDVLDQQRELSVARTRALSVLVEYRKALIDLYLLQGTLSRQLNLVLDFQASPSGPS